MKILKYLIKPLELIMFLCMLAALVYFRSIIFHSNVNQYIDKALAYSEERLEIEIPSYINNDVELKTVVQAECEAVEVDVDVDVVKNDEIVESEVVVAEVKESDAVNELHSPDEGAKSEVELVLINTLSEAVNMINKKVDALFDMNKSAAVVEPVLDSNNDAVRSSLSGQEGGGSAYPKRMTAATVADVPPIDTKQVLYTARKLFWNGNLQASEKLYLELANFDDSDPDVYGELGNVYYAQGKWKQAGKAYYEVAVHLLEQKNNDQTSNRVGYLLRVIQGLDKESADKLKNKISG